MTLTMMKGRVKGAQQGHKLLKRKADALTMKRFWQKLLLVTASWSEYHEHEDWAEPFWS